MIETVVDRGLVPDAIVRAGIRRFVAGRLREQQAGGPAGQAERAARLLASLRVAPIAVATDAANTQHYEMPSAFYEQVLGPRLKYSAGWWPAGVTSLAEAEARMLDLTMERAEIRDGQAILDLGCGWGAFALEVAASYPAARVLAVSNSRSQGAFVQAQACARGLENVSVVTADINTFEPQQRFDRIVSVEMLEHVRNHSALCRRLARWLRDDGRVFVHVFSHREFAYLYEARGPSDWMARHFFTGGMMPSHDWLLRSQDALVLDAWWRLGGEHYQRTAEAWLANFDAHRREIDRILAAVHGDAEVIRWRTRWRMFFMACAEMFGYDGGAEWGVTHYRFRKARS